MEYRYLRDLLEEARFLLIGALDHGLDGCQDAAKPMEALAFRLDAAGLDTGSQLLRRLAEQMRKSGFSADYHCATAANLLATLWEYLAACFDRLDYLEAVHRLSKTVEPV